MSAPTITPSGPTARTAVSIDIQANRTLQSLERLCSDENSTLSDFNACLSDVVLLLKAGHDNAHFITTQFKEVLYAWSARHEETSPLDAFQGFLMVAKIGSVDGYDALKVLQTQYESKLDATTKKLIVKLDELYNEYLEERRLVTQDMLVMFRTELKETGGTWQSDRVNQQKQIELQDQATRLERKLLYRFVNR